MALFCRWIWVSWYQNVSIPDYVVAKDNGGGGDNWSCKTCKALSSTPTNQHPAFYRPYAACPASNPTNSTKALKGNKK